MTFTFESLAQEVPVDQEELENRVAAMNPITIHQMVPASELVKVKDHVAELEGIGYALAASIMPCRVDDGCPICKLNRALKLR